MGGKKAVGERRWWARAVEWVGCGVEEAEENPIRGNWGREWECVVGTCAAVVGMGNLWGFPYQVYKHGGAFLIPFLLLYAVVGVPALLLQQSLGQFTSRGPGHAYRYLMPAAEGLGWVNLYAAFLNAITYNTLNAYNLFYLLSSQDSPWYRCQGSRGELADWSTPSCITLRDYTACVGDPPQEDQRLWAYGACYHDSNITGLIRQIHTCLVKGDRNENYDCGVNLNFDFSLLSPNNTFYGNPRHESCRKVSLFKKQDSCSRLVYQEWDSHVLLKNWNLVWASLRGERDGLGLRIELGNGQSGCWGWAERGRLRSRQRCLQTIMSLSSSARHPSNPQSTDPAAVIWDQLAAYCQATYGNSSNISCARKLLDTSQSLASGQYFKYYLNAGDLLDLEGLGWNGQVVGCFLGAWVMVGITCASGPRWVAHLYPLTIATPLIILFFFFFLGLSLKDGVKGIAELYAFRPCVLASTKVWSDALFQVFFSLRLGVGLIATLASYSRFHSNLPVVTIWATVGDLGISFIASFAMFAIMGHLSEKMNMDIMGLLEGNGMGLAYQTIAELIAEGRGTGFLGLIFYGMLLLVGLETQSANMEILLTWLEDTWPWLRFLRRGTATLLSVSLTTIAIWQAARAGQCLFAFLKDILYNQIIPLNIISTSILLVWLYGPRRLLSDFRLMVSPNSGFLLKLAFCTPIRYVLAGMWMAMPFLTLGAMVMSWLEYSSELEKTSKFAVVAGILLGVVAWVVLVVGGMVRAWRRLGWSEMWRVSPEWGPALDEHRVGTPYVDLDGKRTTAEARGLAVTTPAFLLPHLRQERLAVPKAPVKEKEPVSSLAPSSAPVTLPANSAPHTQTTQDTTTPNVP